jgi:hypothetical protein
MSRNVPRKAQATPTKKRATRRTSDSSTSSSSFDLSDDEGYSAVEDITDSEDDDEEDVDAVEERNILTEKIGSNATSPRPQIDDEEEGEEDDELEVDDAEAPEAAENVEDIDVDVDEDDDDYNSWAGIASDTDEQHVSEFYQEANAFSSDAAVERHVRFDVPSSDSDSTDSEDDHADLFPDIFVSQNSLDPAFRREIEDDQDDDSSASGTFWDYGTGHQDDESDAEEVVRHLSEDETPTATPMASHAIKDEDILSATFNGVQDLDGYESESYFLRDLTLIKMLTMFCLQLMVILPRKKMIFLQSQSDENLAARLLHPLYKVK